MKILITGGAGFIGSALTKKLVERGDTVVIIDNFNDYYDPKLKRDRIKIFLKECKHGFTVHKGDIRDTKFLERVFKKEKPDKIIHLAAMAGVRYAIEHPLLYVDVNIVGTTNLLDIAVRYKIQNFVYASSSSIYGLNKPPFSESDMTDTPISPYAATKKATELLAHCFSHIHGLKTTGLRFFTVYGPWGRPDMGVFKFIENIICGKTIDVYNFGKMKRNFTYIDDIVSGVITVLDADLPCGVMNIGGDHEVALMDYIATVEKYTGKEAKKNMMPMQPGDMASTVADIKKLRKLGWKPATQVKQGVKNFVDWYREYYRVQ
ncbi:MAG: GDP-mannose 4,6-dehydratase [Candidatus Moranbacteria bacterium]|nr:GDP-mannose 4,6-dehydratase [Candidatus Moranbacteria bacterium]MDD3965053.1 GDP-mannose 4,6-dehydratase [Candidatus Moranbacteria bacterium]